VRSKLQPYAVLFLALLALGLITRPIEAPAWEEVKKSQPELNLASIEVGLGQGLTIGLLGGFRAIAADLLWIQTNAVWERNDLPATQTMVRLVSAVDPRPLYFWLNGSRMIALDMPVWRIEAAGGFDDVPQAVQTRFNHEQARVALNHLETALDFHPNHPLVLVEIANIHLRRLDDVETAAEYYRVAALDPRAPYYAARIHAELLRRLGREGEAYQWLMALHPQLDPDNLFAMADVVLGRIRELEEELGIPPEQAYRP
jgi:hypothetical protein